MADPTPSGQPPASPDPAAPPVAADPGATPPAAKADPASAAPANPADPPKAPDKYDFTALKLPQGVTLHEPVLKAVEPLFREFGLSQDAASKLIDAHAQAIAKVEAEAETKRESDFKEWMKTTVEGYHAALRKEWGANHDANLAIAQQGMAKVFSPEAKRLLDETGLGSHPDFVKAFLAVGKMVSEDKPPASGHPSARKSNEEVFYGATN